MLVHRGAARAETKCQRLSHAGKDYLLNLLHGIAFDIINFNDLIRCFWHHNVILTTGPKQWIISWDLFRSFWQLQQLSRNRQKLLLKWRQRSAGQVGVERVPFSHQAGIRPPPNVTRVKLQIVRKVFRNSINKTTNCSGTATSVSKTTILLPFILNYMILLLLSNW